MYIYTYVYIYMYIYHKTSIMYTLLYDQGHILHVLRIQQRQSQQVACPGRLLARRQLAG